MNKSRVARMYRTFVNSRERAFRNVFRSDLSKQYKEAVQYLKTNGLQSVNTMILSHEGIHKSLRKLYFDAFVRWGREMGTLLQKEERKALGQMGFNQLVYDAFERWFAIELTNLSTGITQTTVDHIRTIVLKAIESGYNLDDVVKKIEEKSSIAAARAELIARTETTAAANMGAYAQASDSKFQMQKGWLATTDTRTRDDHRAVDGTIVDLDETFKVGIYEMMHPGDKGGVNGRLPVSPAEVCNCRCTLVFYPKRGPDGRLMRK